jgi:hypothetical protein
LTGKTEIPNPYSLEDNMAQFLENGWGVTIGEGSQGLIDVYCLDSEIRSFTIVLTKIVYNLDGTNTNIIASSKSLLEDIRTVKNDFMAYDQLGVADNIQKIEFQSASGIEFAKADKISIFSATITFGIEYTENVLNS